MTLAARADSSLEALSALGAEPLVGVATVAAYLDVERSWVYEHADEIVDQQDFHSPALARS